MVFGFSIEHANLLAHVLQSAGATPTVGNQFDRWETLKRFIDTFPANLYSSTLKRHKLERFPYRYRNDINVGRRLPVEALFALTNSFSDVLGSHYRYQVGIIRSLTTYLPIRVRNRQDPGLILQLEEVSHEEIALDHASIRRSNVNQHIT